MTALKNTTVYRGGASASSIPPETHAVDLEVRSHPTGLVRLSFNISAAGGGTTSLIVHIGEQDFPALVTAMAVSTEAVPAMAAAVAQYMAKLPERVMNARRKAHEEVLAMAHLAVITTPEDNNEVEKLVKKRVEKLVESLHPKPKPQAVEPGKPSKSSAA